MGTHSVGNHKGYRQVLTDAVGMIDNRRMELRWHPLTERSVTVAPGVLLPTRGRAELTDYHGYNVEAIVSVDPDGASVEQMTIRRREGGPAITGDGIRKLAVQAIVRSAVREGIQDGIGRDIPTGSAAVALGMLLTSEAERMKAAGPTGETIEWVGRVYQLSELVGDPPTQAVEQAFGISRSTAGAWIGRARAAGHISPVSGGPPNA